jgi:hypothetical protein
MTSLCGTMPVSFGLRINRCHPRFQTYKPEGQYLRFDVGMLRPQALDDLLWLQEILTTETLELADQFRPGFYENRADELLTRIGVRCQSPECGFNEAIEHAGPGSAGIAGSDT